MTGIGTCCPWSSETCLRSHGDSGIRTSVSSFCQRDVVVSKVLLPFSPFLIAISLSFIVASVAKANFAKWEYLDSSAVLLFSNFARGLLIPTASKLLYIALHV